MLVKKWRCTVCDELFDFDKKPATCPVCGVGQELFELVEVEVSENSIAKEIDVVIIGGGVAAVNVADSISAKNKLAKITIISKEGYLPYYRTRLTEILDNDIPMERMEIKKQSWYDERNIKVMLNEEVTSILNGEKAVILSNGEKLKYDSLVIATGAKCFVPPFENKDLFERQFPADFISEAVDQTRGWFYSLLAISTLLFNKTPYKNVIVLGHVQDENGQKMSKSKGNAVDPFDALEKYGADAIRWYFYINSAPWLPNRFHGKAVQEGQRKFMGTLWNTYAFFVLYANIDNFDATKYTLEYDKLPVMDKWILSKMNTMVKDVDYNLGNYRIPEAARVLQDFVDDLSNWYVRRSRERFWAKGMEQDKINAYMTLYHALVTIAKTAAPMIPFMTEDIYQNLVRSVDKDAPESIHLCDFPTVNEAWIDKDLEADMKELLEIVVLGRACRNTANIKNRQPIGTMYVKAEKKMSEFYTDIIADELNVKEVKFADDVESFISYSFKPQLRTVGPKYGKLLGGIRQALTDINGTAAMNELRTNGVLKLDINGNDVELTEEDLLIETAQTEGYVSESDGETSVVLDTNLTPELIEEGFVREIISKIQTMRKEAGFEVMDKIVVYAHGNDKIQDVMKTHEDEIKSEVLADEMVLGETDGYVKEWNINKEAVTMGVKKL